MNRNKNLQLPWEDLETTLLKDYTHAHTHTHTRVCVCAYKFNKYEMSYILVTIQRKDVRKQEYTMATSYINSFLYWSLIIIVMF